MRMRRAHWIVSSILLAVVAFLACDNDVRYEVVYDCLTDEKLYAECDGGTSYTCSGASIPGDSDPTLVCASGHPQSSGTTEFCCANPSSATCSTAPPPGTKDTRQCLPDETIYFCTGPDTPSQRNLALHCDDGVAGAAGDTLFCCTFDGGAPGTSCTTEADAGCSLGSTGYDCPQGLVPTTQNPSLHCASPTFESTGDSLYCCTSPDGG